MKMPWKIVEYLKNLHEMAELEVAFVTVSNTVVGVAIVGNIAVGNTVGIEDIVGVGDTVGLVNTAVEVIALLVVFG
jgi:hypothetical protein